MNKSKKSEATDRIDGIQSSIPDFLYSLEYGTIFLLTFQIGDFLKGGFEVALDAFSVTTLNFLVKINASDFVTSLIVDGIIAGVEEY